jgi:hypothetical protein
VSELPDGWRAAERDEIEKEWETDLPILAVWVGAPGTHCEVTLYEDGMLEVEGHCPVELVPFIQLSWIGHMRGKVA